MKMTEQDYKVYGVGDNGDVYVVANFAGISKEWPTTLTVDELDYKFVSNEAMEDWMLGNYSGHAKYESV